MIALALSMLTSVAPAPIQNQVFVEHRVENGDVYCNVRAQDFPVRQLMESLCSRLGMDLTGFEDIENSPKITVFLHDRPLNVTVEYVLGAAGLSGVVGADRIDVRSQDLPFPTEEHSLRAAEIALLSALQRFPESPMRLQARTDLAEIATLRGEPMKAARHYEMLAEASQDWEQVTAARMKAGEILVQERQWRSAMDHYQAVGDTALDERSSNSVIDTVALARRELARCLVRTGDSSRGYFLLRGLEEAVKPKDAHDEAQRLVIRARALVEMGEFDSALDALDRANQLGRQYVDEFEGMDLRARALEAKGHPVDAAVAWLHFGRDKNDEIKSDAYIRAAQAALATDGEELGVIFLHKQAVDEGIGDALLPYVNEARSRLGLEASSYSEGTPTQRLRQAKQLNESGLEKQALLKLGSLARDFRSLSVSERIDYALTYAPLLEREEGVAFAIGILRDVVVTLESVENRTKLYLLAGEIYERSERFDEAAAAYGGQL